MSAEEGDYCIVNHCSFSSSNTSLTYAAGRELPGNDKMVDF